MYKANQIIDEALAGIQDFKRSRHGEAAMYFLRGMRDFKLYHDSTYKDVPVDMNINLEIDIPKDALQIIGVGVPVNGEFFTLTKEGRIIKTNSDPLGQTLDSTLGEGVDVFKGENYGYNAMSVNDQGYFDVDWSRRKVLIRNMDRGTVILRYVTNGVTDDFDDTLIEDRAANLLISYIEWKLVSSGFDRYTVTYRAEKKQDYRETRTAYDNLNIPSIDQFYDAIYQSLGQSARRL